MLETLRDASTRLPRIGTAAPPQLITVDLGQSNDYTAITVITPSGFPERTYVTDHIERVPLNTRYTAIVDHVCELVSILRAPVGDPPEPTRLAKGLIVKHAAPRPDVYLLLDYTGVGAPVLDMFMQARDPAPGTGRPQLDPDCIVIPVTITGAENVSRTDRSLNIPKKDLASVVQRVLQEGRLQIPADDPEDHEQHADILASELAAFRAIINASGHVSYRAAEDWRAGNPGNHDDLVLSLALGLWYGENALGTG